MGDIRFNQEEFQSRGNFARQSGSSLEAWLIKRGIASNQKTAEYVLLGVAAVALLVMFFFMRGMFGGGPDATIPSAGAVPGAIPARPGTPAPGRF